jgi:hypothetical protein
MHNSWRRAAVLASKALDDARLKALKRGALDGRRTPTASCRLCRRPGWEPVSGPGVRPRHEPARALGQRFDRALVGRYTCLAGGDGGAERPPIWDPRVAPRIPAGLSRAWASILFAARLASNIRGDGPRHSRSSLRLGGSLGCAAQRLAGQAATVVFETCRQFRRKGRVLSSGIALNRRFRAPQRLNPPA